jgi:hypothetical protein
MPVERSPREYDLYLLHSSPAANYVRANLPEAKFATPEQRKAFEAFLKAEMEQAAREIMGAEKAKALIEQMERQSKR